MSKIQNQNTLVQQVFTVSYAQGHESLSKVDFLFKELHRTN